MLPTLFSSASVASLLLSSSFLVSAATIHRGKRPDSSKRLYDSNLTPDGYWHNRYHSLLSMAVYNPDYNTLCPAQTFTNTSEHINFPNSTRPPWQVISTFGPTPSGCEGFTAIVPEMNKALIVFKGNHQLEQQLPLDVVDWSGINMTEACPGCTANRFAMQGYLECKAETNNWEAIIKAYEGQALVFSITGHGLGGMHSLIASVDLNNQKIDYYSHTQGAPRTFNQAGANHYNSNFNGEAGERAIYGNDTYTEFIPAGPNYSHSGTPFFYSGFDGQTLGPNMLICWDGNAQSGPITDDPGCLPQPQPNSTSLQDHYYYFTEVTQCGGVYSENFTIINDFLASPAMNWNPAAASTNLPVQSIAAADATFPGAAKVSGLSAVSGAKQTGSSSSGGKSGSASPSAKLSVVAGALTLVSGLMAVMV